MPVYADFAVARQSIIQFSRVNNGAQHTCPGCAVNDSLQDCRICRVKSCLKKIGWVIRRSRCLKKTDKCIRRCFCGNLAFAASADPIRDYIHRLAFIVRPIISIGIDFPSPQCVIHTDFQCLPCADPADRQTENHRCRQRASPKYDRRRLCRLPSIYIIRTSGYLPLFPCRRSLPTQNLSRTMAGITALSCRAE